MTRVLVLADSEASAAGYERLLTAAGHEPWAAVGATRAAALVAECAPAVALVALDAPSSELRAVVGRLRMGAHDLLPVVLALPDAAWWLRVPPSPGFESVAVVRRSGLTAAAFDAAAERLGVSVTSREARVPLAVDGARRRLSGPAGAVRLTPIEGALARALLAEPGEVVSTSALCGALWAGEPLDEHRIVALRTHVYSLRRKLAAVGAEDALVTEPGRGYRLAVI